jgi:FAD synthase
MTESNGTRIVAFIRTEQRFNGFGELVAQIKADAEATRVILTQ